MTKETIKNAIEDALDENATTSALEQVELRKHTRILTPSGLRARDERDLVFSTLGMYPSEEEEPLVSERSMGLRAPVRNAGGVDDTGLRVLADMIERLDAPVDPAWRSR